MMGEHPLVKAVECVFPAVPKEVLVERGDSIALMLSKIVCNSGHIYSFAEDVLDAGEMVLPAPAVGDEGKNPVFTVGEVEEALEQVLRDAADGKYGDSFENSHVARCLTKLFELGKSQKIPFVSEKDAEILSIATALGLVDGNNVDPVYFPRLVENFKKTLSKWCGSDTLSPEMTALSFSLIVRSGLLVGCVPDRNVFESLRLSRRVENGNRTSDEKILRRLKETKEYIVSVSGALVGNIKKKNLKTGGYALHPVLLFSGAFPEHPGFWIPKKMLRKAHSNERFEEYFGTETPEGDRNFDFSGLSDAASDMYSSGKISYKEFWTLTVLDEAVRGYFDISFGSGSFSAWTRCDDLELRIASPLETTGFLDRLEEFASSSLFGETVFHAFVTSCLDAFAPSPKGFDLEILSAPGMPENKVCTEEFRSRFPGMLRRTIEATKNTPFFRLKLEIPVLDCFSGAKVKEGPEALVELFRAIAERRGGMSFRSATALSVLLRDGDIASGVEEAAPGVLRSMLDGVTDAVFRGPEPFMEFFDTSREEPRFGKKYTMEKAALILVDAIETCANLFGTESFLRPLRSWNSLRDALRCPLTPSGAMLAHEACASYSSLTFEHERDRQDASRVCRLPASPCRDAMLVRGRVARDAANRFEQCAENVPARDAVVEELEKGYGSKLDEWSRGRLDEEALDIPVFEEHRKRLGEMLGRRCAEVGR